MDKIPEEKQIELAKLNKRDWGYEQHYEPKLEISMRKRIRQEMGEDYKGVSRVERFSMENRTIKRILEEENRVEF